MTNHSTEQIPPENQFPQWKPLGKKGQKKWLPGEEGRRFLSKSHVEFVRVLLELGNKGTPEAAESGLAMLDTIPKKEEERLDLVEFRMRFLTYLGRGREAEELLFAHLFAMQSEILWLVRGNVVVDWLLRNSFGLVRETLIQNLRELCKKKSFIAPRFILAFALTQGTKRPPLEARALYESTLKPTRWRKLQRYISNWFPHLAGGFFAYIDYLLSQNQRNKALVYGRMILQHPWDTPMQGFTEDTLHLLCLALMQLQLWPEQKKLCERILARYPSSGEPHYWLGRVAAQQGASELAYQHFLKALKTGSFSQKRIISMAHSLLSTELTGELTPFLQEIQDKESVEFLQIQVVSHLYQEELEEALALTRKILEKDPHNQMAGLHCASILEGLGRWEEAESMLRPWLEADDLSLQFFSHLLLGDICLQSQRPKEALQYFSFVLEPPHSYKELLVPQWQQSFLIAYATCLEQLGKSEQAILRYEEALRLAPSGPLAVRLLWLLLGMERWDEAQKWVKKATKYASSMPWFIYARLQMAERAGEWSRVVAFWEQLGMEWFLSEQLLVQGLLSRIRAYVHQERAWEALLFCEEWLPEIVQNPELNALRKQIFQIFQNQYNHMQEQIKEQVSQLESWKETKGQLDKQVLTHQKRESLVKKILEKQGVLHEDLRLLTKRQALWASSQETANGEAEHKQKTSWESLFPDIFAGLSKGTRRILSSAAMLWDTLAASPLDDHGPVIIQLARVIEGEINRRLIDPLVQEALALKYSLSDLPDISVSSLSPKANRVSLGDAAMLLYDRIEVVEEDGSVTTQINPRSNVALKTSLGKLWQHLISKGISEDILHFVQHRLVFQLLEITQLRNRAGHAGSSFEDIKTFTRQDLEPVIAAIFGEEGKDGLLGRLLLL